MRRWEQREAARTGKTIPEVLHGLIEQSGGKWEVIGAIAGMTHQAAIRMFERNGISKPKVKDFEFRGVTASLLAHCRKYGKCDNAVTQYAQRHNITKAEALELYVTGQVKIHHWGVPQS